MQKLVKQEAMGNQRILSQFTLVHNILVFFIIVSMFLCYNILVRMCYRVAVSSHLFSVCRRYVFHIQFNSVVSKSKVHIPSGH